MHGMNYSPQQWYDINDYAMLKRSVTALSYNYSPCVFQLAIFAEVELYYCKEIYYIAKMISFAVLLVAVFLGAANAQPERRCIETPVTWSGYIYLVRERLEASNTLLYIVIQIGLREGKLDLRISQANYDRTEEKIKIIDIRDYEGGVKRTTLEEYRTVGHK